LAGWFIWQSKDIPEIELPPPSLTPVSDETTDWQTYRNDRLGFEFKYPSEWNFIEDVTDSTKKRTGNNKIMLDISFSTSPTIYIQEETNDQYLSLIITKQDSDTPRLCSESEKEIVLGSIKGCKLIEIREFSEGSGGFNPHNLWNGYFNLKNNKYEYNFYYLAGLKVTDAEHIFDQIISTFKFI